MTAEINAHGWTHLHRRILTPTAADYISPRSPVFHPGGDSVRMPTPAIVNEQDRAHRQKKNLERATARADYTGRTIRDAVHAARGVIRALEDLEVVDRLGMLPQGAGRLVAAQQRLDENVTVAVDAVNEACIYAEPEQRKRGRAADADTEFRVEADIRAARGRIRLDASVPDAGDGG